MNKFYRIFSSGTFHICFQTDDEERHLRLEIDGERHVFIFNPFFISGTVAQLEIGTEVLIWIEIKLFY